MVHGIGIDIGTSYCCVSVYRNGEVEVIPDDQGTKIIPSYVAFTDTQILFGEAAKNQVGENPRNTVFGLLRLLRQRLNDPIVQEDIGRFPYAVVPDAANSDKVTIEVTFKREVKRFAPDEIIAMMLRRMKETAETYLRTDINAVITVPLTFNRCQCQAIRDAASIAGLDVPFIIPSSIAPAISLGFNLREEFIKDRNKILHVMVIDVGGGTVDVSVLALSAGSMFVKAHSGNRHLGGEDIDNKLVEHAVNQFEFQEKKSNISKKRKDALQNDRTTLQFMSKLRIECEKAKQKLSPSNEAAQIRVNFTSGETPTQRETSIKKTKLNEISDHLCKDVLEHVQSALCAAYEKKNKDPQAIEEVILVGGTANIHKIKDMLKEIFGDKLNTSFNFHEAVSAGAAIHAARLSGIIDHEERIYLRHCTTMSLGVEVDGKFSKIVKRNTKIEDTLNHEYDVHDSMQRNPRISVIEGDNESIEDNHLVGTLDISNYIRHLTVTDTIAFYFNVGFQCSHGPLKAKIATNGAAPEEIAITYCQDYLSAKELDDMTSKVAKMYEESEVEPGDSSQNE